jgi:hypothetical protein
MSQLSRGVSDLDSYLTDLDRRLQELQDELGHEPERPVLAAAPDPGPASPQRAPEQPTPGRRSGPLADLLTRHSAALRPRHSGLGELQETLLQSLHALIDAYAQALAQLPDSRAAARRSPSEVTLSAGPFESTSAVRAFARALADLPGVRDVSLSGYEGEDRAVLVVQVDDPEHGSRSPNA